jgi:hypothetical protein
MGIVRSVHLIDKRIMTKAWRGSGAAAPARVDGHVDTCSRCRLSNRARQASGAGGHVTAGSGFSGARDKERNP